MKSHRIYIVGPDGRLQLGLAFQSPDDRTAGAEAEGAVVRGQLAELWQGGRLVGRVSKSGVFEMGDDTDDA